jgi:hypothetical protein
VVNPLRRQLWARIVLHRRIEFFSVYATCTYGLLNIPQRLVVLLQFDGIDRFMGITRKADVNS